MSYTIEHVYVDITDGVRITKVNDTKVVSYSSSGDFLIRHPGPLNTFSNGTFYIHMTVDTTGPSGPQPTSRPKTQVMTFPVALKIFSPDGLEFTAGQVTLDDLRRFRDLRSASQGTWRYEAHGISDPVYVTDKDGSVTGGPVFVRIALVETVPPQSAGLLVDSAIRSIGREVYTFDLFRVGQFEAFVQPRDVFNIWEGTMRLRDPDGVVVASGKEVTFPVTLRTISKSRNAAGEVRPWSLEVDNRQVGIIGNALKATVIATTRIPTSVLQNRIDDLLGPNGNKLAIYGENLKGRVLARLEILDEYSAEAMDIHHLLRGVLGNVAQDPQVSTLSVEAHIPYNLANRSDSLGDGLSLDVGSLKVTAIKLSVGASQHIQPSIPAVTIEVDVQGQCVINLGGFELATVSLNNSRITMEAGATADGAGNIVTSSWINDNPISLDISWEAAVLAGILTGPLVVLGLVGLTELIESEVNGPIVDKFRSVIEGAIFQAPSIMAMLLGANFTLTSFRVEAGAIVIDYVAPVEPDPKPSTLYTGVIGRWAMKLGLNLWRFFPRTLGDTWAAGNLAKVDHIVVVMMENRSFDHVLGYRGLLPGAQGENGWSADLINFLTQMQFTIRPLSESEILPNAGNLKTRFPYSVGHMLADVTQQLSARLQAPTGSINSPQGFIDSFRKEVGSDAFDLNNVLGYYEASDLAFYAYLAENYTYCEQYFASHPGPTLPNRMYSLAGDVQYDRVGEAVLDNNNGDNFALSRALNIFDVLSRNGVSWRVYESFPSITMLRMFARYAADNTNVVDIAGLEQDIAGFNLPSVTFIDPAMHHAPENDDHPPFADMLNGQIFIKRVYDALRSNQALWTKTLLIVTYDEHGGFYDHVIPPLADALSLPFVLTDGGAPGPPTPAFKVDMTISYGLRVPTFVVSPWVPAGKGPEIPLDHCSILKTILARFCGQLKPFLTDRVNSSHTFDSFLTLTKPSLGQVSVPVLPTVSSPRLPANGRQIVTRPLSTRIMQEGSFEFHDLTGALARMLGRH